MPGWYYASQEDFRLPIPAEYELAYIDKTGAVVIEEPFQQASNFKHSRAAVRLYRKEVKDDRWHFAISPYKPVASIVNETGSRVGEEYFDSISPFKDNVTIAIRDDESFLVDLDGKIVRTFGDRKMLNVSDGLIQGKNDEHRSVDFYDLDGNLLFCADADEARGFSNGLAVVSSWNFSRKYDHEDIRSHPVGYFNFIDKSGKCVISGNYANARDFKDGYAAVSDGDKWGLIDAKGNLIIPFKYNYVSDFDAQSGLIPVRKGELYGFIDLSNKLVLPCAYACAKSFSEGLAPATSDGLHWGFIDRSGEYVIAPVFQQANSFSCGRALVYCDIQKNGHQVKNSIDNPIHLIRQARQEREAGNLEKAIALLNEAIVSAPDSEAAKRAKIFMRCEMPLKPVPPHAMETYLKGYEAAKKGDLETAKKFYLECMRLAPEFEFGFGGITYVYLVEREFDEVERLCKHILSINPNYQRAYKRLIDAYFHKRQDQQAEELRKQLRELNPYFDIPE